MISPYNGSLSIGGPLLPITTMNEKIIGIDLGTTNSCVAVVEGGKPIVIANGEGYATTPSVVAFNDTGDRLVGHVAKRQSVTNPERTIQSIKRRMGSKDQVHIDHRSYSPEQISALILQKLRKQAQDYLGHKVSKAIITVPAYFDDAQRLATRDAGQIAGLEVVRIINEPTACALTYGLNRLAQESKIIVFDYGGGTFDVTILELSQQVLQVKSTSGNNRLGGDDFDHRIIDWVRNKLRTSRGIDLSGNAMAIQRLKEAAEKAKIDLSGQSAADIQLPFLAYEAGDPVHFEEVLTRQEFNKITTDLIEAVAIPIQMALADAKITIEQIDQVLLVGGTTRIPAVQEFIRGFFHKEPVKSVNPDEAVAIGAAILGGILSGEIQEVLLLDVVPISIGIEAGNGSLHTIFKRNTPIPTSKEQIFTTTSDNQKSIHGHIVQGEETAAARNKSLIRFDVNDIPQAKARETQIAVNFTVDVDGIFSLTAKDTKSGAELPVAINRTHGLTRDNLLRLSEEESTLAAKEAEEEERSAAIIMAQSGVSDAERALKKYKQQLNASQVQEIHALVNHLREASTIADTSMLTELTEALEALIIKCVRSATSAQST